MWFGNFANANRMQVYLPLGQEWYGDLNTDKSHIMHPRLKITETSVSGFSSGAILTANMMSLDPQTFKAAAILAGMMPPQRWGKFDSALNGKKIFIYQGSSDPYFNQETLNKTAQYFVDSGANVTTKFIHDFHHVMPNALPVNEEFNKEKSCGTIDDVFFGENNSSMSRNCGFNLAYYFLQDWFEGHQKKQLVDPTADYLSHGQLLAFN